MNPDPVSSGDTPQAKLRHVLDALEAAKLARWKAPPILAAIVGKRPALQYSAILGAINGYHHESLQSCGHAETIKLATDMAKLGLRGAVPDLTDDQVDKILSTPFEELAATPIDIGVDREIRRLAREVQKAVLPIHCQTESGDECKN